MNPEIQSLASGDIISVRFGNGEEYEAEVWIDPSGDIWATTEGRLIGRIDRDGVEVRKIS